MILAATTDAAKAIAHPGIDWFSILPPLCLFAAAIIIVL